MQILFLLPQTNEKISRKLRRNTAKITAITAKILCLANFGNKKMSTFSNKNLINWFFYWVISSLSAWNRCTSSNKFQRYQYSLKLHIQNWMLIIKVQTNSLQNHPFSFCLCLSHSLTYFIPHRSSYSFNANKFLLRWKMCT
jgi:hypothetical protein